MGNCQAVEMAAATVEYPGGRVERLFDLTIPAQRLMSDYPGHFVALISSSIVRSSSNAAPLMPLPPFDPQPVSFKLLAADAPLRVGHRYRLLSFEEVLTYFSQGGGYTNLARPVIAVNRIAHANKRLSNKDQQLRQGRPPTAIINDHVVKIGC